MLGIRESRWWELCGLYPELFKAIFETLRRTFLKIAVRIEELKSRVRAALPSAYPYQPALISVAGRITAKAPEPDGPCRRMNSERQPQPL